MELKPNSKVYLMGICGTAMASLAGLLKQMGHEVCGSDKNVYPPMSTQLKNLGIPILDGYFKENLTKDYDAVVVGNVISKGNPEVESLLKLGTPYTSLPNALSEVLLKHRQNVVVAGTHGKTTTTSMAAWMTQQEGLEPGYLVGGIAKNFSSSFETGSGDWFVIEGDEYDTAFFDKVPKFIHYNPKYVILTSIEFDHADIYSDLNDVKKAFKMLLEKIPEDGCLIYNGDDENITSLLSYCTSKKISYGYNTDNDLHIKNVDCVKQGLNVHFVWQGMEHTILVPMYGEYNAMNAVAVWLLHHHLDWSQDFQKSLSGFQGIRRRQELLGKPNDISVIEDFAHHPTSVKQTLNSFNQRKGRHKLHAVFEPRSATSRSNHFHKDFAEALALADHVYIAKPYDQSRLAEEKRLDVKQLVSDIGTHANGYESVDQIIEECKIKAHPGDWVVIMSNGGFDGIYTKMLEALKG